MTGLRRSVNKSFMTDLFLKLGLGKPSLKIKTFKMENVETPGITSGDLGSPPVILL